MERTKTQTETNAKQQAELRVILQRGESYALLARLTVRGDDVYCGFHSSTGYEVLRSSHHATGQRHTYVAGGAKRVDDAPGVPLRDLKGLTRLWTGPGDPKYVEWKYQLKPESNIRHNFIVNIDGLDVPCTVDILVFERGRYDVLLDVSNYYLSHPVMRVIAMSKIIDWTTPRFRVVAWRPSDETVRSLNDAARAQGLPEGDIGGFVLGPGPPIGPPVTVWPEQP